MSTKDKILVFLMYLLIFVSAALLILRIIGIIPD